MANEEKHRKGEGNNLLNSLMISPLGEVVFKGIYADAPVIKEEDGYRRVYDKDGVTLILEVPLAEIEAAKEQQEHEAWKQSFKDPDEGDIEVSSTTYIATGELYRCNQPAMQKIPSVDEYIALDREAVSRFNARHRGTNYELQVARGPSYGAGDIEAARVVLLYANGGYDPEVDELKPVEFSVPGWPLTWLSPESAKVHPGAHRWLSSRLRELVEKFDAQFIAQQVANLNIVPWSSTQYHARCLLPSREVQLRLARAAAARGAILVAVRARSAWEPVLRDYPDQVVKVRNPRCSHISQGNLGEEGWQRVIEALGSVPAIK